MVVCVVFFPCIGRLHLGVVGVLGILAPLGMAWLGGHLTHEVEQQAARPAGERRGLAWFGVVLFVVACAEFSVLGFLSSGFMPALHDEWSYLFGAETLALGRLANATPTHPEFFDAFHVLTSPRWVTRYPPGHPALLALGVLAGWPPGVAIALCAGTAVWIYLLGRELGDESVGRLAGVLALMAPGFDFLASGYLSQTTFLFSITGCYVCTIRSARRMSIAWAAAAGALGGWAILTRPYSAGAFGLPLSIWLIWQLGRRLRPASVASVHTLKPDGTAPQTASPEAAAPVRSESVRAGLIVVCAIVPMLFLIGLLAIYNLATTGDPLHLAWSEYNRQFEPDNTLGFSTGVAQPIPPNLNARKRVKAQSIASEKLAFTWFAAMRRSVADPRRLSEMVFPAVGFFGLIALVPFSRPRRGVENGPTTFVWWLLVAGVASHYVAYSFFYSTWGVYGYEPIPLVLVLVAAGCVAFWRQGRDSDRPGIAAAVPLIVLAALAVDAREVGRFIERRQAETKVHREFRKRIDGLDKTPAIVFVRFDPGRRHEYDLINNSPDLHQPVLVALHLGEHNSKLLEAFPERHGYLFDQANGSLTPWSPARPDVPARWPSRRLPTVAISRQESKDR